MLSWHSAVFVHCSAETSPVNQLSIGYFFFFFLLLPYNLCWWSLMHTVPAAHFNTHFFYLFQIKCFTAAEEDLSPLTPAIPKTVFRKNYLQDYFISPLLTCLECIVRPFLSLLLWEVSFSSKAAKSEHKNCLFISYLTWRVFLTLTQKHLWWMKNNL